jgi:Uma2 family endonuclease
MSSHARLPFLSVADYLDRERTNRVKHEYVAGRVFAMGGASDAHNRIAGRFYVALYQHLRGGPCNVYMSDMKLRIDQATAFYYPDLLVTCDPADTDPYFKSRPVLVIEILSSSTESVDRREKLLAYQQLDSLREYALVSQDSHRVEVVRRDASSQWSVDTYENGETVRLESVELSLEVGALYHDAPPRTQG